VKQYFPAFPAIPAAIAALALVVAGVWLAAAAPPVGAADFDKAGRAYAAGDFATAAREWLRLAEAGDMTAQFNLALLHDDFQGGLFDSAKAASWYRRAAAQGLAAAQFNLAAAYQIGRGVPKDMVESLFWLLVAARAEDQPIAGRAGQAAAELGALLSEEQNQRASGRAQNWQAKTEETAANSGASGNQSYIMLSDADVMTIQRRLAALGYDPGPIDGVAGNKTRRAIAAFFKDRDVEWQDGPLSRQLLDIFE
jgi:localization factor PodJL